MLDVYKTYLLPNGWSWGGLQDWSSKFANILFFSRKSFNTLALAGQVVIGLQVEKEGFDVFQFVNPLIGTANGGKNKVGVMSRLS